MRDTGAPEGPQGWLILGTAEIRRGAAALSWDMLLDSVSPSGLQERALQYGRGRTGYAYTGVMLD